MAEVWKNIKGYEGKYQISDLGRIKSLGRFRETSIKNVPLCFYSEKILKQSKGTFGYNQICLCKNGEGKTYPVHRLVGEHFILNLQNKKQINHKDGNKINNNVKNLEWVTYHENLQHAIDLNLRATCEKHGATNLSNKEVLKIRELYSTGKNTIKELSKRYKIAYSTTQQILSKRYWKKI